MTYEEAMLYVRNAQAIVEVFGEQPFRDAVESFNVNDFTTREIVRWPGDYYRNRGYQVLRENIPHQFEEFKGEWSRKVWGRGTEFLVPNPYQLKEGELILAILHRQYPYTTLFPIECYRMDGKIRECYMKTDAGSLYIPFESIVKGDFTIAEKRHTEYHKSYYHGAGREEYLKKALSVLDDWKTKAFRAAMEGWRK